MTELAKEPVLKTGEGVIAVWVRIPVCPPVSPDSSVGRAKD